MSIFRCCQRSCYKRKLGNGKKTSKERRCMELHNYNTMHMASLEIKTFDAAKQKVIAKVRHEIGVRSMRNRTQVFPGV